MNISDFFIKPKMVRRMAMVLIAQMIMGFAVALLKQTLLGTDPFSAMMMGLTAHTPLSYGNFCALGNCTFFVIEILWGRKYIGFGTLANWFLLGYFVMFWNYVIGKVTGGSISGMPARLLFCVIAIVILAFSLSLYQSADIGSSPYDSMPLVIRDRLHVPFFAARIFMDAFCVVVCIISGGLLGLGTVMVVAGLGPIADFFNKNFSEKLVAED